VRVPDYARDNGVVSDRKTETFAQITLWVDNERWHDVPFVLRSGKALGRDRKEIRVHFHNVQGNGDCSFLEKGQNLLRMNLASEEVNPELWHFQGNGNSSEPRNVDEGILPDQLPPYGRLFLEAISGKSRLFIRNDEVEEMWKIIQPIADGWAGNVVPLQIYRAGSNGPPLQDKVVMTDGNSRTKMESPS
jgi:glucose-6-phosphate 1-dehydrogenase